MRMVGIITTAVGAALLLLGLALGVRSLPDIQRYLRMRAM
jgi:hypothetical protein